MKKIPIGRSGIKTIVDGNYIYVDKTKEIKFLIDNYDFAFFSRPRRFGKSLTIDTVETLFTYGVDPYFKNSYIAGKNDDGTPRWNYKTCPVIRLDFSSFTSSPYDLSIFREKFTALLRSYDKKYGMEPTQLEIDLPQTFDTFVSKLLEKYPGGFVLLIDEYDFNLNSLVDNNDLFEQFRLEIRNFYSKIKESKISDHIIFMLVTGVTRFKDVAMFSAGSNIRDVTYNSNLSTIVGYTREEIEYYFKEYIDAVLEKQFNCKISELDKEKYQYYKNNLLDNLALNYDNICYDERGEKSVFSTWSINNFFNETINKEELEFDDYWFESGGIPTILVKYLQNHLIDFSHFKNKQIVVQSEKFINPTSFQSMDLNVLMAQTGYLSLTKGYKLKDGAVLSIPNNELRRALASHTVTNVFENYFTNEKVNIEKYLAKASVKDLVNKFNEILGKIPRKDAVYNFDDEYSVKNIIQTFLLGANICCYREVYESIGRPDLVIELKNKIIIVEFKFTKDSNSVQDKLLEGLNQIQSRDYGQSFDCCKEKLRVAVVYDACEKKIVAFQEC